jgi:YHS domain-containing protein
MRNTFTILFVSLAVLLGGSVFAADSTKTVPAPEKPKLHAQSLCPIMGEEIDSTVYADVQGQRVYFCCGGCIGKFKASADKYFKQAAAEGVQFENVQKTCAVTGEKLENKKVFTDYQGRRIYFCCKGCLSKFTAAPTKYLKGMDQPADSVKTDKTTI